MTQSISAIFNGIQPLPPVVRLHNPATIPESERTVTVGRRAVDQLMLLRARPDSARAWLRQEIGRYTIAGERSTTAASYEAFRNRHARLRSDLKAAFSQVVAKPDAVIDDSLVRLAQARRSQAERERHVRASHTDSTDMPVVAVTAIQPVTDMSHAFAGQAGSFDDLTAPVRKRADSTVASRNAAARGRRVVRQPIMPEDDVIDYTESREQKLEISKPRA